MPSSCCIPGCRTNCRENERCLSVFKFPDDPVRRNQWEWAVQQLYDPTFTVGKKGQKICIRHFEENFIEKEHRAYRDDGTLLIIPRRFALLSDAAVPTLFDFLPDPVPPSCVRREPVTRISSLQVLREMIELRLRDDFESWTVAYCEVRRALSTFKLHITEAFEPEIRFSVTIDDNLVPHIVHPIVSDDDLPNLFKRTSGDSNVVVDEWKKFVKIVRFLEVKSTLVNPTHSVGNLKRKRSSDVDNVWETVILKADGNGSVNTSDLPDPLAS